MLEHSTNTISFSAILIGPSKARRSPALQQQVRALEERPDIDYHLVTRSGRAMAISIDDSGQRLLIRLLRREAMTRADHCGAEALAHALIEIAVSQGQNALFPRDVILEQFCKEYGKDMRARLAQFERTWPPGSDFLGAIAQRLIAGGLLRPEDRYRAITQ